nr:TIGR03749 family integrating conjugative element protein [Pantoea dispersa]
MKKYSLIFLVSMCFPWVANAVELMKWERIPLQVPLTVGQERIVFVNKNVRVGFPPSLNNKLRIQSNSGVVYLNASEAFPVTRLELQNKENGEIILLDVSAASGKTTREPVKIVYDGEVAYSSRDWQYQQLGSAGKFASARKALRAGRQMAQQMAGLRYRFD